MEQSALHRAIADYHLFEFDSKEDLKQKQLDAAFALCPLIHQKTIAVIALLYARYEITDQKLLEQDWDFLKETFENIQPEEIKEIKKLIKQAVTNSGKELTVIIQNDNYFPLNVPISTNSSVCIQTVMTASTSVTPIFISSADTSLYIPTSAIPMRVAHLSPSTLSSYFNPGYYVRKRGLSYLEESLKKEFSNYIYHHQLRGPLKEDRKIFKRQYKLLGSVIEDKEIHCFLNGKVIELTSERTGITYKFRLDEKRLSSVSSFNRTYYHSTPYLLDIFDRDQVYLASLCVVIKDTPVLDQLAALILYIRSGEDALVLKTANMHTIGDLERLNAVRQSLELKEITGRSGGKSSRVLTAPKPIVSLAAPLSLTYKDKYKDLTSQPKYLNLFK